MKTDASKAVQEVVVNLRRLCESLPGAEEYVMVHHPAFRVGKKPFVIAGMEEAAKGATISVNLGRDAQPSLDGAASGAGVAGALPFGELWLEHVHARAD